MLLVFCAWQTQSSLDKALLLCLTLGTCRLNHLHICQQPVTVNVLFGMCVANLQSSGKRGSAPLLQREGREWAP